MKFSTPGNDDFQSMPPPWLPVTPQKPLPLKPQPITPPPNWQHQHQHQLGTTYNRINQAFNPTLHFPRNGTSYGVDGGLALQNHVASSYSQLLGSESSSWNGGSYTKLLLEENAPTNWNLSTSFDMAANAPPTPLLHSQMASQRNYTDIVGLTNQNCSNGSYSSSRPTVSRFGSSPGQSNVANWLLNDNYSSSSNLLSNGQSSTHINQNVPMPLQGLGYVLNYPPRTEADTTLCGPSQLQFTPYKANHLESNDLSAIQTSLAGENSRKEKGKQVDFFTSTGDVAIQNGGELLQTIVESASATISTPYKENKDSDKDGDGDIDINETPLSKTLEKRKKYMPKVIIEGKPKRTPKPASEEPLTGKRKYVRKSIQKESSSQLADGIVEATEEPRTGKRKYVWKNTQKEFSSQLADGTVEATEELRTGKRKYVRKNTHKESLSQLADGTGEAAYHNAGKGRKSCRRVLEFVLETTTVGKGNAASNNQSKINLETEVTVENQRLETTSHPSMSHLPSDYIILPEQPESAAHIATRGDIHITNFHISADGQYEYAPIPQHSYSGRIGQHTMGAKTDGENHEKTEDGVNHRLKALSTANEGRGSKREYFHTLQKKDLYTNDLSSSLLCQEIIELDGHQESSYTTSKASHKKQKVNNQYSAIHDMSFKAATVEEGHGRVESKRPCDANSNGFAAALNHTILKSYIGSNRMEGEINGENKSNCNSCKEINQVLSFSTNSIVESCKQLVSSPPRKSSGRRKKQVLQSQEPELATILESVSGTDKLLQKQDFLCDHQQSAEKPIGTFHLKKHINLDSNSLYFTKVPLGFDAKLPLRTIYPACMDDIIHQLSVLSINVGCNEHLEQEKNALVPYRGDGAVVPYTGSEYIKKRKSRPKVELDSETYRIWNLLMGKEEGSEGTEGPDKQKEKYWEEERKVFRGRVDSFVARMHLVQGDRRFSRWKGSVVDSVIGVFLTQNVSDHLSSSAFMSLAARFPVRSVSNHQTQDKVGTAMLVKEPEVCIQILDDATKWSERMTSQPIYNPILMAPYESAKHQRDSETSRTEKNLMDERSKCLEDEFVSSPDSFGSSITQGSAGIRSYSVSNSGTEDPTATLQSNKVALDRHIAFQQFYHEVQGCPQLDDGTRQRHKPKTRSDGIDDLNCTCSITNLINLNNQKMQPSISPSSSNHLYMYQNSGESEPFGLESFSEDSISSCWQTATKVNMEKDGNHKSFRNKQLSGTLVSSSVEQSSLWAAIKDPYGVLRTDQQHYSQPKSSYEYYQPSCNIHHRDGNQTFRLEEESFIESVKHSEGLPGKKNDTVQHVPNFNQLKKKSSNAGDSISTTNNGSVYSNTEPSSHEQPQNEIITKASKGRKKKSESDKKNTVDWDNLRKQVMADGRKKGKNTDAMDSLDYEALRNANVTEISNAIRERGMNNMLAERIQEFLNRVVKDHGSIDLEWLRDVPPEKAKDYLLSIRGLGLKSVECVRLLTLHHLAFPVDTNVGRIAVRLGWVPLQPLPESLQLHLLELYPMLESIQKYLWPRLCKLDQLTLYELHYQMITFGKVFCTKSKPNCNACPMRGECRHFASAFASARLALPGPEEKSIVSSTSTVPEKIPPVPGNVMSLPSPGNYLLQEVGTHRSEPIIEEPATPEQEFTNLSESDIEDLYNEYEDPDEIPTINVSIQQFTDTLQNYMQKNMDIQEGDMSKALVALNPQAASLPTPKLKNVSRLRTEHQVYELPDSHPLLQGMDIREPDDPSPYLLAIWTPGETAHSFQPPESRCGSQDGNTLCSEKTCFSCNSIREEKSQIVRGTILTPCRTAMRGSFPLNGTYFQVNEMFADHASSVNPIDVPRGWIWNLPRRPVYFGTSVTSIFRGLSTEGIQHCFWRGYVCVRGFDRNTRAPKPLIARLHFPQSKLAKKKDDN